MKPSRRPALRRAFFFAACEMCAKEACRAALHGTSGQLRPRYNAVTSSAVRPRPTPISPKPSSPPRSRPGKRFCACGARGTGRAQGRCLAGDRGRPGGRGGAVVAHLARVAPASADRRRGSLLRRCPCPTSTAEFFLVDPLDGTKEFVKGGDDFTVNVALVRERVPVVGVVLAPASGVLYAGVAGQGAWSGRVAGGRVGNARPIRVRAGGRPIDVVASKSHRTPETDAYIARYPVGDLVSAGSSLKFCTVAEGEADLYPRMGTTMQWDTAAGDAVLRAAGGRTVTLDGAPLALRTNGTGLVAFGIHGSSRRAACSSCESRCRSGFSAKPRRMRMGRVVSPQTHSNNRCNRANSVGHPCQNGASACLSAAMPCG